MPHKSRFYTDLNSVCSRMLSGTLANFYKKYGNDFDFIINSCHIVNGMDPYYGTYFKEMGATRGLMNYFETILANLEVFPHYQSCRSS